MRRVWVASVAVLVGLGVGCTPRSTSSPPKVVDVPGSLVQGQTVEVESGAIERGGVDHNDGWIARSRVGGDSSGITAQETTLTPRNGPGVADLGTPQVLSPTVYSMMDGMTPAVVVSQPWLGDRLLLAGGVAAAGPNQIFLDNGGTWQPAGTFTQDPMGEDLVAFSDTRIVTCPASGSNLRVYPVTTAGTTVTVGAAVAVALPAGWGCAGAFFADFDGSTMVMASGDGRAAVATVDLANPTTATATEVWSTTSISVRGAAFDRSSDGTTLRAAIGGYTNAANPKGRVIVVKQVGTGAWSTEKTLSAPPELDDDSDGAFFGSRVAIDDDVIVTGARLLNVASPASSGTTGVAILGGMRLTAGGWKHALTMTPTPPVLTMPAVGVLLSDLDVAGKVVSAETWMAEETGGPLVAWATESWRFDAS